MDMRRRMASPGALAIPSRILSDEVNTKDVTGSLDWLADETVVMVPAVVGSFSSNAAPNAAFALWVAGGGRLVLCMGTLPAAISTVEAVTGITLTTTSVSQGKRLPRGSTWSELPLPAQVTVSSDMSMAWAPSSVTGDMKVLYGDDEVVGALIIPVKRGEVVVLAGDFDASSMSGLTFESIMPALRGTRRITTLTHSTGAVEVFRGSPPLRLWSSLSVHSFGPHHAHIRWRMCLIYSFYTVLILSYS